MKMSVIVGFMGAARAGKSTAAKYLRSIAHDHHQVALGTAFAEPLKTLCANIFFDVPDHMWTAEAEEKERDLGTVAPRLAGWSVRRILQHVGTEGFRHIDPHCWSEYAARTIDRANLMHGTRGRVVVTFDDVRFPEEAETLRKKHGIVVAIERPSIEGRSYSGDNHASELSRSLIKPDITLRNDGGLEDLRAHVYALYQRIK